MTLADRVLIADPPLAEGGVLSFAAPFPAGSRWESGVTGVGTGACLEAGTHQFCPSSPTEKQFQGIDTFEFSPYAAEVSVECSTLSINEEAEARARRIVRARAEYVIGAELASGAITGNPSLAVGTPTAPGATPAEALSILEGAIATTFQGLAAWVHVAPSVLVDLVAARAVWRDLSGWRTPGGHVVVSSPGYQAVQDAAGIYGLSATMPVTAEVGSEMRGMVTYDRELNRRQAVFEVPVLAVFDPCGVVVTPIIAGSPSE